MNDVILTRRGFACGVAAVGVAAAGGATLAAFPETARAEQEKSQYGFWVDTVRCKGCGECVEACKKANGFTDEEGSNRTVQELFDSFGNGRFVSNSCMHCSVPSCASVCPAGAVEKRADGIVAVDHDRCIGCKYCYQACPFAIPRYSKRVGMIKCDCCLGAGVAAGDEPNCVSACKHGALHYGKIDELKAQTGGRAQSIQASTGPNCLFS